MPSISEVRDEVHRDVAHLLKLVESPTQKSAAEVEAMLWTGMLRLGAAFIVLRAPGAVLASWPALHEVVGNDTGEVGTKFGKVAVEHPVGLAVGQRRPRRDRPMSRTLGLPAGFTLPLVTLVAKFCAMMAFAPTRETLRELLGWAPAPRSVLRMVDAVGGAARGFLEQAEVPEGDTDVLLILADGKGAAAISSSEYAKRRQPHRKNTGGVRARKGKAPKKRRGPGKKSKNAKMAAVGVICTLKLDSHGHPRPVNKRIYATFTSYRALFKWLREEAVRRGYGTDKFTKVQFVADGAEILWDLQQEFFPDADPCLDWIHAVEKLWASGKAVNRGTRTNRDALETWVHAQRKLLREGRHDEVVKTLRAALDATPPTGPGNKFRRKVLDDTSRDFVKNQHRMHYDRLRREKLVISSGLIEGTVRHLVGMRLDGPGMRWGKSRAEAVLHLRCVLLNGLWTKFESYLGARNDLRLAAKPAPTVTHDAKPVGKKAA